MITIANATEKVCKEIGRAVFCHPNRERERAGSFMSYS